MVATLSDKRMTTHVPVLLSPWTLRSELVLEYEKPTPAGDSKKSRFAAEISSSIR